jgi:hypothetical protein
MIFNFYGGGTHLTGRNPIRAVECTTHFRVWIAAREERMPANAAPSYVPLQMLDFATLIRIRLNGAGANPVFRREYDMAVAAGQGRLPGAFAVLDVSTEWGPISRGSVQAGGRIGWSQPPRHMTPVVTPPFANDFYNAQWHAQDPRVSPATVSTLAPIGRCLQRVP